MNRRFLMLAAAAAAALLPVPVAPVAAQSPSPAPSASPAPVADLAGVWRAQRLNGPEVRGRLIVVRDGRAWRAEIAGRSAPVTGGAGTIAFALAGGRGSFAGRWEARGAAIVGHWVQPKTLEAGQRFASPVRLVKDGPNVWRGEVVPLDDHMTFYLVVKPAVAGSGPGTQRAFLINPERNLGFIWDVDRLERDGDAVRLVAAANGRRKGQVVVEGVYRGGSDVISLFFTQRDGTWDFERIAPGAPSDIYPRDRPAAAYRYAPPVAIHDGWPVARLEDAGLSRARVESFVRGLARTPIDSPAAPQIDGVLIARHGKLVLEEYFHGQGRDLPHDTRSAAKSLTSTLYGAAVQAGLPVSASTSVYRAMNGGSLPRDLDPRKRSLTVESLLTMSSGLDCDDGDPSSPGNEDNVTQQTERPDWYAITLGLKMTRTPGTKAVYCSIQPNLVGGVLARATHRPLADLFHDLLAEPLQIERYYLPLQPTGDPYMGGGVRLSLRDFLKFGQLLANGGTWNGRRVVSRAWAARATSPLARIGRRRYQYGYLWWETDYPYRGRTVHAFYAAGNGGQTVMAIPALDLVLAIYAGNYGDGARTREIQLAFMPKYVLPAVIK